MNRRRLVRVPASSANLGPGFDCLAAALSLHLEVEVLESSRFEVITDLPVARDRRNHVVRGFEALHSPDGFSFRISSNIPLCGGMGSSAAAVVAGAMAADHLFELDADLLAVATELEGHPDNAAAALLGGVTISPLGEAPVRLEPPTGLEGVIVAPRTPVRTRQARAALPGDVPLADASFNAAHTALLVLGLSQGDWDLVSRGLRDRLHQPYRVHLFPRSAELLERAQELGALGATVSGAGPSILFWSHYELTGGLVEALRRETDGWAEVLRVPFELQGAEVRAL